MNYCFLSFLEKFSLFNEVSVSLEKKILFSDINPINYREYVVKSKEPTDYSKEKIQVNEGRDIFHNLKSGWFRAEKFGIGQGVAISPRIFKIAIEELDFFMKIYYFFIYRLNFKIFKWYLKHFFIDFGFSIQIHRESKIFL